MVELKTVSLCEELFHKLAVGNETIIINIRFSQEIDIHCEDFRKVIKWYNQFMIIDYWQRDEGREVDPL